jgi:MscS family membrane protein
MFEFLQNWIGNAFLRFIIVFVVGFVVVRFILHFLEKLTLALTVRTKTKLDDLIVQKTSKPLTFLVLALVLKISLEQLSFPENIDLIISRIVTSIIIIFAFYLGYVIIDLILFKGGRQYVKDKGKKSLVNLGQGFMKVIVVIFALMYLLYYWGIQVGPVLAGLGVGGIAIAFAMQSSLANIFGGISIILDKTVKEDDLIKLEDETMGTVLRVGIRSTQIKTFDNELVFIPNAKIADGKVQNIGMPEPKSRVVIPFGVAYGSDVEKVRKVVLKELKKIEGYIEDPEPNVRFLEMGDSSLKFKAFFYVDSYEKRFNAIDMANTRIYNALNKAGISIPFPQMDVHLKK